jgi:hypothetical protein
MSTRSVITFVRRKDDKRGSAIYKHYDGYPSNMLPLFDGFFDLVEKQSKTDTRFDDPSYLAARFVAYASQEPGAGLRVNFTGFGIVNAGDECGQSYDYVIVCAEREKRPEVWWRKCYGSDEELRQGPEPEDDDE